MLYYSCRQTIPTTVGRWYCVRVYFSNYRDYCGWCNLSLHHQMAR